MLPTRVSQYSIFIYYDSLSIILFLSHSIIKAKITQQINFKSWRKDNFSNKRLIKMTSRKNVKQNKHSYNMNHNKCSPEIYLFCNYQVWNISIYYMTFCKTVLLVRYHRIFQKAMNLQQFASTKKNDLCMG